MSAGKTTAVKLREYRSVTEVLEACIELSPKEREEFLQDLSLRQKELKEDVELLLTPVAKETTKNELRFLTALVRISKDTSNPGQREDSEPSNFSPFQIGNYLILQELGRGGMAQVFRAKKKGIKNFEKSIAVKRILSEYVGDKQFLNLFEFEAHLSALLHHPNIVQIFDFFSFEKSYYIVMEFVPGRNAAHMMSRLAKEKTALPLDCALYIAIECLKGLDYAHHLKDERTKKPMEIVHRDVSPKNVMLGFGGEVKLVDFGIAKAKTRADLTRTGSFRGTVSYMAPEILRGRPADSRSDVFSSGLLLYELVSGKSLFQSEDVLECMELVRVCDVSKVNDLDIDPEIKRVIHKALSKSPEERYQGAEEFLIDLQKQFARLFPAFLPKRLAIIMRTLFSNDIEDEQRGLNSAEQIIEDSHDGTQNHPAVRTDQGVPGLTVGLLSIGLISVVVGAWIFLMPKKSEPVIENHPVAKQETPNTSVASIPKPDVKPLPEPEKTVAIAPAPSISPSALSNKPKIITREQASIALNGACATILRTNPKGANILHEQSLLGKSPFVAKLPCNTPITLRFELEGHAPKTEILSINKPGTTKTIELK